MRPYDLCLNNVERRRKDPTTPPTLLDSVLIQEEDVWDVESREPDIVAASKAVPHEAGPSTPTLAQQHGQWHFTEVTPTLLTAAWPVALAIISDHTHERERSALKPIRKSLASSVMSALHTEGKGRVSWVCEVRG